MDISYVLDRNKEMIVRNCITHFLWFNDSVDKRLSKSIEALNESAGLNKDITREETRKRLENYIASLENEKVFNKWIKRIKSTYPERVNFKQLMKQEELPFKNKYELHRFIKKNLCIEYIQ